MPEVVIYKHTEGTRSIHYELGDELKIGIDYYTIKTISQEQLDEIKSCSQERVQVLLSQFI